ncbi:uncharacterized protein LOC117116890 [Anneissia japonica]|uniref:uncharacterized protein LOC117116890 n=1 Tax=Anneissia japonica TaxID=1529436 RepID=UPI00142550BC|nr:uncharacterized protein LOC117116890 [Anneissia japonica]
MYKQVSSYIDSLECYLECSVECAKDIPGMPKPTLPPACSPCDAPFRHYHSLNQHCLQLRLLQEATLNKDEQKSIAIDGYVNGFHVTFPRRGENHNSSGRKNVYRPIFQHIRPSRL